MVSSSPEVRLPSHRAVSLPQAKSVFVTLNIFIRKLLIDDEYHKLLSWEKNLVLAVRWLAAYSIVKNYSSISTRAVQET